MITIFRISISISIYLYPDRFRNRKSRFWASGRVIRNALDCRQRRVQRLQLQSTQETVAGSECTALSKTVRCARAVVGHPRMYIYTHQLCTVFSRYLPRHRYAVFVLLFSFTRSTALHNKA